MAGIVDFVESSWVHDERKIGRGRLEDLEIWKLRFIVIDVVWFEVRVNCLFVGNETGKN